MELSPRFLSCHIAAIRRTSSDPFLAQRGFAPGVVAFAIPDYGVLFRCRAAGDPIDLEFGAFFSLLRFVKTRLTDEKIKQIRIFSSDPEFVFSFTGKSRHLNANEERRRLLAEYSRHFTLDIQYIRVLDNKALLSASDFPALPIGTDIHLSPEPARKSPLYIRPFRRGIDI